MERFKSVDQSLGRILDKLDELRLTENTIVIFTSDNGGNTHSNTPDDRKSGNKKEDSGIKDWRKWAGDRPPTNNAPLRDGKGRLYEGGVRVPMMVRWPGKIAAAGYARENDIPCLGLCLGLQCMVIEYARSVLGLPLASSAEFDPDTPDPVIATMADQHDVVDQRFNDRLVERARRLDGDAFGERVAAHGQAGAADAVVH